jgi:hypothetical protein
MMIVTGAGMTATMIWVMAGAEAAGAVVAAVADVAVADDECTVAKSAASASKKST